MKRLPSITALAYLILFCSFGFAQERSLSFKLYNNFEFYETKQYIYYDALNKASTRNRQQEYNFGYFSPALTKTLSNGNFQEIELSRLIFNHRDDDFVIINDSSGMTVDILSAQKTTQFHLAFRFEHNLMLFKNREEMKLRPYFGFALSPYLMISDFVVKDQSVFPISEISSGLVLSIIPRVNYAINDRFFLDLSIPITFYEAKMLSSNYENPILNPSERNTRSIELEMFPNHFLIRIGAGLRL